MKGFIRYITENWFWISMGCVLTVKAVEYAYLERGCVVAYGGEWLVLPVILLSAYMVKEVTGAMAEIFLEGGGDDE